MARSLSQALTRTTFSISPLPPLILSRNRSSGPEPPVIRYTFDGELDSDTEKAAIRKLEDAVHRIIVKRSQPDWLPFRPGSSYWVPPKSKSRGFAQVIDKLANSVSAKNPAMAIASNRGWPSSEYFFKALSSSTFISKVPETHLGLHKSSRSSTNLPTNQALFPKSNEVFLGSANLRLATSGSRVLALSPKSKELYGDGAENPPSESNDGGLVFEENPTVVEGSAGALKINNPLSISGSGGRTGLFRTPISGGVQSATSAHGLPRPALAVRNLLEQARFAHLCTAMSCMHHRREGYPFGSLVDFSPDSMGHPIFSFSPLAIHTRNLLADPRCTLVVQVPGWSGLSNARVTIFGDVYPLPESQQEWAHKQYIAKHQQGPSQQWGNFYYFRMQNIRDIYFIGGFGTVAWVDVKEFEEVQPDKIALEGGEQCLKALNALFSKPLKELLSTENEVDDAALISIDSKGTDVRIRQGAQFNIQRISFEEGHAIETLEQATAAMRKMIGKGRLCSVHK